MDIPSDNLQKLFSREYAPLHFHFVWRQIQSSQVINLAFVLSLQPMQGTMVRQGTVELVDATNHSLSRADVILTPSNAIEEIEKLKRAALIAYPQMLDLFLYEASIFGRGIPRTKIFDYQQQFRFDHLHQQFTMSERESSSRGAKRNSREMTALSGSKRRRRR